MSQSFGKGPRHRSFRFERADGNVVRSVGAQRGGANDVTAALCWRLQSTGSGGTVQVVGRRTRSPIAKGDATGWGIL